MKTTAKPKARSKSPSSSIAGRYPYISPEEFRLGVREWWAKFHRMPKAKQRARMIELGMLTPEGKVPVYPMDHVPLGPRE
ncbi:MAG TPA: hypothetical protein DDZ88_05550 [Verrucomicrobiales bacterium]|nr:hypothetical protein [Verrucomicrobiales bacterium]